MQMSAKELASIFQLAHCTDEQTICLRLQVPWETDSEMSVQAYGGALGIPPVEGQEATKMRQREGGWVPWEADSEMSVQAYRGCSRDPAGGDGKEQDETEEG